MSSLLGALVCQRTRMDLASAYDEAIVQFPIKGWFSLLYEIKDSSALIVGCYMLPIEPRLIPRVRGELAGRLWAIVLGSVQREQKSLLLARNGNYEGESR